MIEMQLSAVADTLNARLSGDDIHFRGCSTDTRTLRGGELFIALHGDNYDGHDFIEQAMKSGASSAIIDKKQNISSFPTLQVEDTREAMAKLAQTWRQQFDLPLIAVTGSNGKTSVKEMLVAILSGIEPVLATHGNLNNDIGVPLTLFGLGEQHRYAVIEMGANHPGEIAALTAIAKPDVALITLCAPAHIEGFGSIEGVAQAKAEIYQGLQQDGIAIINADDAYADYWSTQAGDWQQLTFGIENSADISAQDIVDDPLNGCSRFTLNYAGKEIEINLPLPGVHNIRNALAATCCCHALEVPINSIRDGLESMKSVKGRMQFKKGIRSTRIVDDTYNANPASLEVAMETVSSGQSECWLVLGDMGELGETGIEEHIRAGRSAKSSGFTRLYAVGDLCRHSVDSFGTGAEHFTNKNDLITELKHVLKDGVTILVKGSRSMTMEKVVNALVVES